MLQQTQVSTVIPYYTRFIQRFPNVIDLAEAELDEVLHLWTGLGYYARGRNLHRTARIVRDENAGEFPSDLAGLIALPGIGRSTASAILALSQNLRHPILDGNVKRVLSRYHALEGWPGTASVEQNLWSLADAHTPHTRVAAYTQAIMDLGATLCTRTQPNCLLCPFTDDCAAHQEGREADFPTAKPKRPRPTKEVIFAIVRDLEGRILLELRPPRGIWGGLWGFPEFASSEALAAWVAEFFGNQRPALALPPMQHGFSHYLLLIRPHLISLQGGTADVMEDDGMLWYKAGEAPALGLSAPVAKLLASMEKS